VHMSPSNIFDLAYLLSNSFLIHSCFFENHRQFAHSSAVGVENGAWPGQTDHLNAKSRGRLRLPIEAAETARARLPTVLLYNYTTALLTDTRLTQPPLHPNKSLVSLNLLVTDIYKNSESLVRFEAAISSWGIL
jgi:hypothetical protein